MSARHRISIETRKAPEAVRAGIAACRVDALHDVASRHAGEDARAVRARVQVIERVNEDVRKWGVQVALQRAADAYRQVPIVPDRLRGRHPAARARGEALERVLMAAGVDASQIERLHRARPRYVDDPQAAS